MVGVKENKRLGEVMAEKFLLGITKMFKIDCGDGCTTLNIRKATELYIKQNKKQKRSTQLCL